MTPLGEARGGAAAGGSPAVFTRERGALAASRRSAEDSTVDAAAPFVGRDRELTLLVGAFEDAASGRGRVVLVSGEPGIGKTRLCDELASIAREHDTPVAWGRCWEAGGAPPYWPWVQVLRTCVRAAPDDLLRKILSPADAELAQLLPEIEPLTGPATTPGRDPEAARFRLFDATARFLASVTEDTPLLVVIDDLHAADTPSLLLLRFVAGEVASARVLVVSAFRPPVFGTDETLRGTITELMREPVTTRLELGGLTHDAVASILEQTTGSLPSPAVVATITAETEGNALFVTELGRLLLREGGAEEALLGTSWRRAIPAGVRQVIRERLSHLPQAAGEFMTLASVLGREFSADALAALAGTASSEVREAFQEAEGLVEPGSGAAAFRFAHSLIRESIYDDLAPVHRARLHAEAAEVLERVHASDLDAHLAEIAHHHLQAAGAGTLGMAVDYARRAGARAASQLAFEEAVRLQTMALQATELDDTTDDRTRLGLLLELGDSQARSGDSGGAKRTFVKAADLARRLGQVEELAHAALGYGGRFVYARASGDQQLVPLLEDALERLGDTRPALRIRLLARLSGALRDEPDIDRRDALSREAVELARDDGDPSALAYALIGRFAAIWGPDGVDEMKGLAAEAARVAEATGDTERQVDADWFPVLLTITVGGSRSDVQRGLERLRRRATSLRQPSQLWYLGVMETVVALSDGRFGDAGDLIAKTLAVGRVSQPADAVASYRIGIAMLRREQGRLAELEETVRRSIHEYPGYRMFRALLAEICAETGNADEAKAILADPAGDGLGRLPKDNGWLFAMCVFADVCDRIADVERAAALYEEVLPYAGLVGQAAGEVSIGCASRALGVLALRTGRLDDAELHLLRAIEVDGRMEAHPWLAHSRYLLARVMLQRDRPGDEERAAQYVAQASATCSRLGMPALAARLDELHASVSSTRSTIDSEPSMATFRRDGEYWSIAFDGRSFRLRDSKGLRYLARLLADPGTEVHVFDLVGWEDDRRAERAAIGDAGGVLDATAKAAYRARLEELRAELEEAESWNDPERAARAKQEIDFLAHELAGAVGLGGRDRKAVSASERARVNVTRAIKSALIRVSEQDDALGRHLEATVKTGTFCSYEPDPRTPLSWRT